MDFGLALAPIVARAEVSASESCDLPSFRVAGKRCRSYRSHVSAADASTPSSASGSRSIDAKRTAFGLGIMERGGKPPKVACSFACGRDSSQNDLVDEDRLLKWGKGDADRIELPNGASTVYGSDSDWYCDRTYIQIYRVKYPNRRQFHNLLITDRKLAA